jgi:hypothetical protein
VSLTDVNAYQEALQHVKAEANLIPTGARLIKVEHQIVAGINYRFRFQLEEEYREIVVWKQLDGNFQVTSNEAISAPDL